MYHEQSLGIARMMGVTKRGGQQVRIVVNVDNMTKTFSKDSLKVGDIIKAHNSDVGTIVEVLERTMCVFWGTDQIFWYTYLMAMERGWTILQDEEEKPLLTQEGLRSFTKEDDGTTAECIDIILTPAGQKIINVAIIKNNEELVLEIRKIMAENRNSKDKNFDYRMALFDVANIIQSKNDSLSKE